MNGFHKWLVAAVTAVSLGAIATGAKAVMDVARFEVAQSALAKQVDEIHKDVREIREAIRDRPLR